MRKLCLFYLFALAALLGCQWQMSPSQEQHENPAGVVIDRFDRVESLYLTMADYAALRQMKTDYPLQTRNLVENVLQLGKANDPQIDSQLLTFFQDTTLQTIINDVEPSMSAPTTWRSSSPAPSNVCKPCSPASSCHASTPR